MQRQNQPKKTERACDLAEGSDKVRFVVSGACGATRVKDNLSALGCGHRAEKVLLNEEGVSAVFSYPRAKASTSFPTVLNLLKRR